MAMSVVRVLRDNPDRLSFRLGEGPEISLHDLSAAVVEHLDDPFAIQIGHDGREFVTPAIASLVQRQVPIGGSLRPGKQLIAANREPALYPVARRPAPPARFLGAQRHHASARTDARGTGTDTLAGRTQQVRLGERALTRLATEPSLAHSSRVARPATGTSRTRTTGRSLTCTTRTRPPTGNTLHRA
jgi:hypothetical protein